MTAYSPSDWFQTTTSAINLLKIARDDLSPSKKRDDVDAKIKEAEELLAQARVAFAKELGFPICRCHFPGEPMLWSAAQSADICPKCGTRKERPRPTQVYRGRSWTRARGRDFDVFSGE
jgi:hypothetical protein